MLSYTLINSHSQVSDTGTKDPLVDLCLSIEILCGSQSSVF